MRLQDWPLRRLLILAFALLALLAVLPVSVLNVLDTRQVLRARGDERLARRAETTAARIEEHLRDLVRWARELDRRSWSAPVLAGEPLDELTLRRIEVDTVGFLRDAEHLEAVVIADPKGRIALRAGEIDTPEALPGWPPFRRAAAGETVAAAVRPGDPYGHLLLLVPLGTPPDIRGVVILQDDFLALRSLVENDSNTITHGSFGILTDERGVHLIHGGEVGQEGREADASPAAPHLVQGPSRPLEVVPWTYSVTVPAAWYEAPILRQIIRVVLAGLLALLVATGLSMLLARWLARPFSQLERAATAWRAGRRDAHVDEIGIREAARFAAAFNAMAEEIHAYERQLEQRVAERTAELEAANRDLELFSYSASHDLQAPLRTISGFADILMEDCGDDLPEDARDLLQRILTTSQGMRTLIDDLLGFGRVSRMPIERQDIDLGAIGRHLAERLAAEAPERKVVWTFREDLLTRADPQLAHVVLDNLLGNAWKYTSRRDEAHIELGRIPGPEPTFFVRDDGAGFDMAHAEAMFQPFRRLHTPSEFPGTGIGLATVERIISRHGGRIYAEGEPGRGATFYFTFGARAEG